MYCKKINSNSTVYGYDGLTYQQDNDSDIIDLYKIASNNRTKLVVMGGVHGYVGSGEPTGQDNDEKKITSFSRGDQDNKRIGSGINFIYKNLAIYTTNGSDITKQRQKDVANLIKGYQDSGHYVLLSWCYSKVWAVNEVK